jgi:hypothetical protein
MFSKMLANIYQTIQFHVSEDHKWKRLGEWQAEKLVFLHQSTYSEVVHLVIGTRRYQNVWCTILLTVVLA